ncbi:MAG: YeeE/YedE thiosulfate transporter family protein [Phycisphaerales bacterium]
MLIAGLLTGIVFGFLLQRGGVTRYNVIVGQFLMKDFTVLKTMLTAIIVGAVGIWGMLAIGMMEPSGLHIKSATLLANGLGGVIFGVGMAILGYCPGTGVAALGDGSRHAWPGLLGMIFGAGVYAEVYPYIMDNLLKVADEGKVTFADVAGISPWWFILGLVMIAGIVFYLLEKPASPNKPTGHSSHHKPGLTGGAA